MTTPYEPVLRHEPAIPGAKPCHVCLTGILNTPCQTPDCGCACGVPPSILQIPEELASGGLITNSMVFQLDGEEQFTPGYFRRKEHVEPLHTFDLTEDAEEEEDDSVYLEALHVDTRAPLMLLTGTLIGGFIGVAAVYPSVPLAARVILGIIGAFILVFLLATFTERNDDA